MRFKVFFPLLVVLLTSTAACLSQAPKRQYPKDLARYVSLISLIATPERFDGQLVLVTGWVSIGFRHRALHYSSERRELGGCGDSIWLEFSDALLEHLDPQELGGHYVLVKGVFDMNNHGGAGLYQGTIDKIQAVVIMDIPAEDAGE